MNNSYHVFVIITTVIVYIFLSSKKNDKDDSKEISIVYLLSTPVILYSGYYFLYNPITKLEETGFNSNISTKHSVFKNDIINYSDDLLSDPYPVSSNSKF